jgi:hypothetical protein
MEKFYSKKWPHRLLHFVIRKDDFVEGRQDLIEANNFLQCSTLNLKEGTTFKPHQHIWKFINEEENEVITQESWCVLSGKVKCIFYDLDNSIIAEPILEAGDASFTLEAGHNYLILEDGTRVLEYKTGPYKGQKFDKEFI